MLHPETRDPGFA